MNECINLIKILKDCPKGTEFYHAIYGRVWFYRIDLNCSYPIRLSFSKEICDDASVTSKGLFHKDYDGECLLFPSKYQRDWSKFSTPWYKNEKFDPKTLGLFDKVLVKISNESYNTWYADFVAEPAHVKNETPLILGAKEANMVIPYNDETKHLVGTTEEAPEYYRYWEE